MRDARAWIRWLSRERARARIFGGRRLEIDLALDYLRMRRDPLRPPKPRMIQIEPTRRCNLSCIMCLRTGRANPDGEMSFDVFRSLIERDFNYRHHLLLYGQGEPLLCKDLFKMIRYERRRGNFVVTVTNGTLLGEDAGRELARSDLNILRVSIDAATDATYGKVRRGATLGQVVRNVASLKRALSETRAKTELAVTFMALKENYREIPEMVKLTRQMGVPTLEIKELPPYADSSMEPLSIAARRDPALARNIQGAMAEAREGAKKCGVFLITSRFGRAAGMGRCMNPWFKTYVGADGSVTPCSSLCFSPEAVLGHLPDDRFEAIWLGEAYRQIRKSLLEGEIPFLRCRKI